MASWIEVPAHRIYVIFLREIIAGDFIMVDENGNRIPDGNKAVRIIRVRDNRMFKPAKFWLWSATVSDSKDFMYCCEEV